MDDGQYLRAVEILCAIERVPSTAHLVKLADGIPRDEVHMATRSRKGYWRMSGNSLVQRALTNRWLHEQGVPDMRTLWIVLSAMGGSACGTTLRAKCPCLSGTAVCGPACTVVWDP